MDRETVTNMVRASGVSAGELVLIHFWGENQDRGIADQFAASVAALGASPVVIQQSRSANREIFRSARETAFDQRYFQLFSQFDAVLDVFAYQPVVLGAPLEEGPTALYRRYMAHLFGKLMGCRRFTQIRVPTEANAAESGLEPQEYLRRMEAAYAIDYDGLRDACRKKLEHFAGVEQVVLHTGQDCALSLELAGRPWHIDAGDGDLPCGEIYIAPVEEKTQGRVYFETLYLEHVPYRHVTLDITGGEVTGSSCGEVGEFFAGLPRENRIVCELGLGMNPHVTSLCGYTVLDEKMAGTFHIAVGANDMFGGNNHADDHVDLVGCGRIECLS